MPIEPIDPLCSLQEKLSYSRVLCPPIRKKVVVRKMQPVKGIPLTEEEKAAKIAAKEMEREREREREIEQLLADAAIRENEYQESEWRKKMEGRAQQSEQLEQLDPEPSDQFPSPQFNKSFLSHFFSECKYRLGQLTIHDLYDLYGV